MNAFMTYSFVSQQYERSYVFLLIVKNDFEHASTHAILATNVGHKF